MTARETYAVLVNRNFVMCSPKVLAYMASTFEPMVPVWSARLSTGILGHTDCPVGNRGPKGRNEILLALGDSGLRELIDLGFIPCAICQPDYTTGFWHAVKSVVEAKYGITNVADFADKEVLGYDARRIAYEQILPHTRNWPGRLYMPKGLAPKELASLKRRIDLVGFARPHVGYWDDQTPDQFTEYELP